MDLKDDSENSIAGKLENFKPVTISACSSFMFKLGGKEFHVALLEVIAEEIRYLIEVPVSKIFDDTKLKQITDDNCDRQFLTLDPPFDHLTLLKPIFVSGRKKWIFENEEVKLLGNGVLLDGARRLELLLNSNTDLSQKIPVFVIFNLTIAEEKEIRKHFEESNTFTERLEFVERFDTTTTRFQATNKPVVIKIMSDPFGMPTARGYVAAVMIRRPGKNNNEHLIVSAMSLTKPLEELRMRRNGTLKGAVVAVHKDGDINDKESFKRAKFVVQGLEETAFK